MYYLLCFILPLSLLFAQENPTTVQHTLPLPFSYFENLYLDTTTATFFSNGKNIHPEKAIAPLPKRGYSFGNTSPSQSAQQIKGTTLFLFEFPETKTYLNHFFHLLEHVVGIWALYGDLNHEEIRHIVLCSDGKTAVDDWAGPNGINRHLLKALFPHARVVPWNTFLAEHAKALLCFERAVTSDRALTLDSSECAHLNKMLGVARHFLSPGALTDLYHRVHAYAKTPPKPKSPFQITYLTRPLPRALFPPLEEKLLQAIQKLDGVVVKKYDFARLPFEEQIQIIGHTDLLISVHGNGLSHILFLPPTASVIEIFPAGAHCFDYQLFAEARGLPYCKVLAEQGVMSRKQAYERGVFGNPNQTITQLTIAPILAFISQEKNK